jgi:hypothetical protein
MLVEHTIRKSVLNNLTELSREYHIDIDPAWIPSSLTPWEGLGWFTISRTLDGQVSALLRAAHFMDALQVILEWLGAEELSIDPDKEEFLSDINPPDDIPMRDGWKLLTFYHNLEENISSIGDNRLVYLDDGDMELAEIRNNIQVTLERIRGDNQIEHREAVLASLSQASNLLSRAELALIQLKVGVVLALDDAITMASGWSHSMLLEAIRASVTDWIRRQFGI